MSLDDEQKKRFEERLAKEIEDAKYSKWKSKQVNHSQAPSEKIANAVVPTETPGDFKDEAIRRNLKGFKETFQVNCLECGYRGMAGVTRTIRNSFINWSLMLGGVGMVLFSLVMGLGGYIYGLIAALLFFWGAWSQFSSTGDRKIYVKCPNCLKELGPIKA